MTEVTCVLDAKATLGESPVWSARENALYWVDIPAPALHRLDLASGSLKTWKMPETIGCLGLRAKGGAVVTLREDGGETAHLLERGGRAVQREEVAAVEEARAAQLLGPAEQDAPRAVGHEGGRPRDALHVRLQDLPGGERLQAMPGFGKQLDDRQLADLATYLRGTWGGVPAPVTLDDVRSVRPAVP